MFCNRSEDEAPFLDEIESALAELIKLHSTAAGTRLDVAARLTNVEAKTPVYCCGPGATSCVAVEAATAAWPEGSSSLLRNGSRREAVPPTKLSGQLFRGGVPDVRRYAHRPAWE